MHVQEEREGAERKKNRKGNKDEIWQTKIDEGPETTREEKKNTPFLPRPLPRPPFTVLNAARKERWSRWCGTKPRIISKLHQLV